MEEYFRFLHIGFLDSTAKFLGVTIALTETIIGTALITGVWKRLVAIAACALQGFFTLPTLLLVIFNPEMDCGCFGEAVHMTHMETFIKNIILCLLLAAYTIPLRHLYEAKKRKYASFGIVTISVIAFTIYSLAYIPLVDFTAYKPDAELHSVENANEQEMYEAYFVYEKDGVQEKFTLEDLPDSTWTFITTETIIKGDEEDAGISLPVRSASDEYADELAAEGKVMIISLYDIDIKTSRWNHIAMFANNATEAGFKTLILASGTPDEVMAATETLSDETKTSIYKHLYFSDYKTLISLNRSNGGATYFSRGHLVRKWAYRALPDRTDLSSIFNESSTSTTIEKETRGSLTFQGFLLYVFAVMLLL
jgi:uncharacterized membrane protein YphA (DoxX/SURF4 family)